MREETAALRDFNPAYVRLGSKPESHQNGRMSASTGCRHCADGSQLVWRRLEFVERPTFKLMGKAAQIASTGALPTYETRMK
jgi:hypothetical protein